MQKSKDQEGRDEVNRQKTNITIGRLDEPEAPKIDEFSGFPSEMPLLKVEKRRSTKGKAGTERRNSRKFSKNRKRSTMKLGDHAELALQKKKSTEQFKKIEQEEEQKR